MSVANVLSYSAITTKIRAMRASLLTDRQFEELAGCASVPDAVAFLSRTPAYSGLFGQLDASSVHREQVERLLKFSTYEDFSKIWHFAKGSRRDFLNLYFMRYEIATLKRYMRSVLDPRQSSGISITRNDFEKHSAIRTQAVAQSADMGEFVENLKGTVYYDILSKVHSLKSPALFDYETGLDLFYFTELWKKKDKLFRPQERAFVTRTYGTRIDLLNILWICRLKRYYHVQPSAIFTFLIPVRYKLKKSEIIAMAEAENADEAFEIAANTFYGRKYPLKDDIPLESWCSSIVDRVIQDDFRREPYSLAAILAFLHDKDKETAKIITTLECIRYGYSPSYTLQYVKERGSNVL